MDDAEVGRAHGVQMFIIIAADEDDLAHPFAPPYELLDVLLAIGTRVSADHSHKVVEGASFGRKRSWRRVLEQELTDALSRTLSSELSLFELITWREENHSSVVCDAVLSPP